MASASNVFVRVRLGTPPKFSDISAQVIAVDIEDVDRGSDKATVTMSDQVHVNTDTIREGTEVRIELGWETEHALLFIGEIRRTESIAPPQGSAPGRMRFIAFDFSVRMQKQPDPALRAPTGPLDQILKTMAERAGIPLAAVEISPMPTFGPDNPFPQGTMTDWETINVLAQRYHARAFVEVNVEASDSQAEMDAGGAPRLYFASEDTLLAQKPMGKLIYCRGFASLMEFETKQIGPGASAQVSAAMVDPVTGVVQRETGTPHAPDVPVAIGENQIGGLQAAVGQGRADAAGKQADFANQQQTKPQATRPVVDLSGAPSDPAWVRDRIQRDKTRLLGLFGTGMAMGTVMLRAKGSVEISGLANITTGLWYVRKVNHLFERERTTRELNWFTGSREVANTRLTYRSRFEATR